MEINAHLGWDDDNSDLIHVIKKKRRSIIILIIYFYSISISICGLIPTFLASIDRGSHFRNLAIVACKPRGLSICRGGWIHLCIATSIVSFTSVTILYLLASGLNEYSSLKGFWSFIQIFWGLLSMFSSMWSMSLDLPPTSTDYQSISSIYRYSLDNFVSFAWYYSKIFSPITWLP